MGRNKSDKVFSKPLRISDDLHAKLQAAAREAQDRMGREVAFGEILDTAWKIYEGSGNFVEVEDPKYLEAVRAFVDVMPGDGTPMEEKMKDVIYAFLGVPNPKPNPKPNPRKKY